MKPPLYFSLLASLLTPGHSQSVLEWALSETSTSPDIDVTPELNGTLEVPILGDGLTTSAADSLALVGRFEPVTLTNVGDSLSISYEVLIMGGASGGQTNADFRWGLFNSQETNFGGEEADFSGWSGVFAWNSGATTSDADVRVRDPAAPERFYVGSGMVDLTADSDFANQDFVADGVIYTVTLSATRLVGDTLDVVATLTGDNGYALTMSGQDAASAEFTFDRVAFWSNALGAELIALKSTSFPASTDGDNVPDLEEARLYSNLDTVSDFRVTSVSKAGNEVTLSWGSSVGRSYDIRAGDDLLTFPFTAAGDVSSQGDVTTHQFTLPTELVSASQVFFVVEERP